MSPDIFSEHLRLVGPKRSLIYCDSREDAARIWAMFVTMGVSAQTLHAGEPGAEHALQLRRFEEGLVTVLIGTRRLPDLLRSQGFDRRAEAVVLLSPTGSREVHETCFAHLALEGGLVLDFAGNVARHGLPQNVSARVYSRPFQLIESLRP